MSERSFNWALGLSVCSWAVLGLLATGEGSLASPVRWEIAALNLTVGLLFLWRRPVRVHGGWPELLQALPAVVVPGLALKLSPTPIDWPAWTQVVFLVGVGFALWSLLSLGRCFAVLPAGRGVVTRGPYRLVRHPVYLGELVMLLGCALAAASAAGWGVLLAGVVLVAVRCRAEERVLTLDPAYRAYRGATPDMLLPGLSRLRGVVGLSAASPQADVPPSSGRSPAELSLVEPNPGANP